MRVSQLLSWFAIGESRCGVESLRSWRGKLRRGPFAEAGLAVLVKGDTNTRELHPCFWAVAGGSMARALRDVTTRLLMVLA